MFASGYKLEQSEGCPDTRVLPSVDCNTCSYITYALTSIKGRNVTGFNFKFNELIQTVT